MVVIVDSCGSDVACNKYDGGHGVPVVIYLAAGGESNRLTVSRAGDEWTLADPAAPVTARDDCRSVDAHTATCTAASQLEGTPAFSARLRDGDDALAIVGGLGVRTSLEGGDGADTLTGGDESDRFFGGPGADRIEGGPGDTLSFADRREPVTVDLAAGTTSDGDTVRGIERVEGGQGADRLLGGPGADTLLGGRGDDVISGRGGRDTLSGELGADRLDGGAGEDRLRGDPPQGDDYYTPRIRLRPDVLRGGPGDDTLTDTGGANRLEGGSGDDLLEGGSGADRLIGGSGADWLNGHRGADRLSGGAGRDEMRGGSGADRLSGGAGVDRLIGGSGPDRLLARDRSADDVNCGRGRDRATIDAKDSVHACERLRGGVYTSRR
jgi:Ca2+-binding RTX toxin-like protein